MRIDEVIIKQSDVFHDTDYERLFHICDSHGFAYAVQEDALKSLRHGYVSTTYDPTMNEFLGMNHPAFKFVLDGKALVRDFGARTVDFHTQEIGGGRSRHKSLGEREIGIQTKSISPLSQYLTGVVIIFPLYRQKALQDLLYDHSAYKGFMDQAKAAAPRGIETIFELKERGVPIWYRTVGGELSKQDWVFLRAVKAVHDRGGDFEAGMRAIAARFPLQDHQGNDLDKRMVTRRQKREAIVKMLNSYYTGRRKEQVKPAAVKGLMVKILNTLGMNNNISTVIIQACEEANLFHPVTAPVQWTGIVRDLMNGDIERALDSIKWTGEEIARHIEWYDSDERYRSGEHYGTMMA